MRFPILAALLLAGSATAALNAQTASPTPAPAPAKDGPQLGSFGFDTAGMDRSVAPGDDFDGHASGTWNRTTEIPADRSSYGMFHVLQDLSLERQRSILQDAARTPGKKIGDFYTAYMDEATIDARGIAPVKPWLDQIAGATDKAALVTVAAGLQRQGIGGLFGMGVTPDPKSPDTYVVMASQGGLTLPDRDYYLKDDAKLEGVRTAYRAYLAQLFTLAGEANAVARADAVFAFEKAVASGHWTRIESRDADKTYNKWTPADFAAKAPGFPWQA